MHSSSQGVQDCQNPVIPAKAGIQTGDVNPVSLDSHRRRSGEKNELAHLPGVTAKYTINGDKLVVFSL